ncbi:putative nuclear-interacting partner of ALK/Rsm1 [Helianthus annuus]|nr:putative nuclear-interacting partner of ALK/Rsm1 [Helianthus annuus]
MSTPVLEHFLKCPPTLDESEQVSPILYYQAQKLISLCGWEPRLLPYIVDCNDAPNAGITVYSSRTSENVEENVDGKEIKFDPIKQHRYFCPWVSSNGKLTPGWKQTLSALERQKEFVYSSETTEASSSLIEVEDPVGSVKKLLTPPSAKRKKIFHGSS